MNRYNKQSQSTPSPATESRLQALLFPQLNSDGSNFLEWVNDAKLFLSVEDLARTLIKPVASTSCGHDPGENIHAVCKWQAVVLLRRHLDHTLRIQ